MKIFHINSFFSVGGPPRVMKGIYLACRKNGIDCKMAASRDYMTYPEDSVKIGNKIKTYINAIRSRFLDDDGFCDVVSTKKLIKEIENYNPDVIHLHNLHGYYIESATLFSFLKSYGKPVVWTLHDCWSFTGHCPHFVDVDCMQWKSECYDCVRIKVYPACVTKGNVKGNYHRKKDLFNQVDRLTLVTPSKWLNSIVRQSFLSEKELLTIYNGVDTDVFKPTTSKLREELGLKDKKVILGVAQHWIKAKGLYEYIELAETLPDKYRVVLVGNMGKEYKKELPPKLIVISPTNTPTELAAIYTMADLFLNLSKQETFGLVTAEALACGTPAFVFDTTACPEVIDEKSGRIMQNDWDCQTIKNYIVNGDWNTIRQEDCRKRAEFFSESTTYNSYINLYKKLCQNR